MATTTLPDIRTEGDIKTLVDSFCQHLYNDEMLAPAFNAMARIHWPYHLTSMYQYWSSTLLGSKTDKNGEAIPHNLVLPVTSPHFQRWVNLFYGTVAEHFAGSKAEEAKLKALSMVANS